MFLPNVIRVAAAVGLLLTLTLAPTFLWAQSPDPTEGPRTAATDTGWQARFDAGWKAYQHGRYDEAADLLGSAEREAQRFPEADPRRGRVIDRLAWIDFAQGRLDAAEVRARRALAWRQEHLGAAHHDVAQSLHTLGCVLDAQGRLDEAEPLYTRALSIEEKVRGAQHPNVAALLECLANLHHAQDHLAQAESDYRRALEIREQSKDAKALAPTLYNLAVLYFDQGEFLKAEPLFQRAVSLRESTLGATIRRSPRVSAGWRRCT